MALAELAPDQLTPLRRVSWRRLGHHPPPPRTLGLPPGVVPIEPVSSAIDAYRAGAVSVDRVIATVDRWGDDLEIEWGRQAIAQVDEFTRTVGALEDLHRRTVELVAGAEWMRRFPWDDTDQTAAPLSIMLEGQSVEIPIVLVALRTVVLPDRVVLDGSRPRPNRNGGAPRRRRDG